MGYNVPSSSSIIFVIWSLVNNISFAFGSGDIELGFNCKLAGIDQIKIANLKASRGLLVKDFITHTSLLYQYDGYMMTATEYVNPREKGSSRFYGLTLCRGDVSPKDCNTCIQKATLALISSTHCPDSTSAIIWHEYCLFKYSYIEFFGNLDTDNYHTFAEGKRWVVKKSEDAVKKFLTDLINMAVANQYPRFKYYYANSSRPLPRGEVAHSVYGLAQCTGDHEPKQCKKCLDFTLAKVSISKQSGQVVCGSCNLKFETYDFFKR